jgi:Pectate lyase superfamily protein
MLGRHFHDSGLVCAVLLSLFVSPHALADPGAAAVFNVRDFGATGDGVTDDAEAIRDTVAAAKAAGGGTVYIPAGTYMLGSRPAAPGGYGLVQLVNVSNVDVVGDGPTSVVKLRARDWRTTPEAHAFWCKRCVDVSFRDMTIDGSRDEPGFVGQERMSGVYAFQSVSITVQRVRLEHVWGDGVQLVGTGPGDPNDEEPPIPVVLTEDVVVRDSDFFDNGRSGIGVQGSTRDMQFLDNFFEANSDQDIDFEPTGHRLGPENVLIQGNTMIHATAAYSVTLGGQTSLVPARNIRFIDNTIDKGSVQLFNVNDGLVAANTIISVAPDPPGPAVNVIGAVTSSTFRDNIFERRSAGGPVVHVAIHSSKRPSDILLENNEIRHTAGSTGVDFVQTGNGIVVRHNDIIGSGGGLGVNVDLSVSDGLTRSGVVISDNTIRNFDHSAIQLHTVGTARFGVVTMCRNTITDSQPAPTQDVGIKLQVIDVNSVQEAVVCDNTMGAGVVAPVVTNAITRFRGTGSPQGVVRAPVGSTFIRTDEENRRYDKVANPGSATGWEGQ